MKLPSLEAEVLRSTRTEKKSDERVERGKLTKITNKQKSSGAFFSSLSDTKYITHQCVHHRSEQGGRERCIGGERAPSGVSRPFLHRAILQQGQPFCQQGCCVMQLPAGRAVTHTLSVSKQEINCFPLFFFFS